MHDTFNIQLIMNIWEEEQVAENLKIYNKWIQLMRYRSDNNIQDSPKITQNREQCEVSTYIGFPTGVENIGDGSLKFDGGQFMGEYGRGCGELKTVSLKSR